MTLEERDLVPDARCRPRSARAASNSVSSAATLVGLETPQPATNLEIKPYGDLGPDDGSSQPAPRQQRRRTANAGFDVKYGLTKA